MNVIITKQITCLTANKNETSEACLNSTSQSYYNKFSKKEFSTLLCLRYNLDLDFIPTNLQCTCKRKNKIMQFKKQQNTRKKELDS